MIHGVIATLILRGLVHKFGVNGLARNSDLVGLSLVLLKNLYRICRFWGSLKVSCILIPHRPKSITNKPLFDLRLWDGILKLCLAWKLNVAYCAKADMRAKLGHGFRHFWRLCQNLALRLVLNHRLFDL